jgi:hypothetical protein
MIVSLAWCLATILLAIAALHLFWAAGLRPSGAVIPERDGQPVFAPRRPITMFMALLFTLSAWVLLVRSGAILPPAVPVLPRLIRWATWGIAMIFVLRAVGEFHYVGFFKRGRTTRFARMDDRVYSPLALLLGMGSALIAAS